MTVIEEIVDFVRAAGYNDIPVRVRDIGKQALVDAVGCMIAGTRVESSEYMYRYIEQQPHSNEWRLLGRGRMVSLADGALACGFFAHALDFDNASNYSGHSSAVIGGVLVPVADCLGKSGKEVLRAYLVAQEVGFKLAMSMVPDINFRGWHITPVFGTISATVACAMLMELSEDETAAALSLAASKASGMMAQFGTVTKFLHCGIAAAAGVECCRMAKAGLRGSMKVYEGKNGFFQAFSGREYPSDGLKLGAPWAIEENSLLIKLYPCCSAMHTALNGARKLQDTHGFSADEVETVTVEVPQYTTSNLIYEVPQKPSEGRFSMQFGVANMLVHKKLDLDSFTDANIADEKIKKMMSKIKMQVSTRFPAFVEAEPCDLSIRLSDGREFGDRFEYARGRTLENPCGKEELFDKFVSCTQGIIESTQQRYIFDGIYNIEKLGSMKDIISIKE